MGSNGANIQAIPPEQLTELSRGFQFEITVLGAACKFEQPPEYRNWEGSFSEVLQREVSQYNPAQPTGGLTPQMIEGVRQFLPRKQRRHLRLYLALATSLDYWHGVDAFFYYHGAIVTLDVASYPKPEKKADFLITPAGLVPPESEKPTGFSTDLLRDIAYLLIERQGGDPHKPSPEGKPSM